MSLTHRTFDNITEHYCRVATLYMENTAIIYLFFIKRLQRELWLNSHLIDNPADCLIACFSCPDRHCCTRYFGECYIHNKNIIKPSKEKENPITCNKLESSSKEVLDRRSYMRSLTAGLLCLIRAIGTLWLPIASPASRDTLAV